MSRDERRPRVAMALLVSAASLVGCTGQASSADATQTGLPEAAVLAEVVFIVRVTGEGEDVRLEVPLPIHGNNVRILEEEFRLRGFAMEEVVDDGMRLAILELPALEGRRRFTYKALLAIDPLEYEIVSPEPGAQVTPELRRHTLPTPRLQSRSPLVRERLIDHLEPALEAGERDLVKMIFRMVGGEFERRTTGGTSNVLRALREDHASDLGLDRLLVTFMRASGIPARNVTGFRLRTDGGRKLERWTEIHVGGAWVPMSPPKGWYGVLPPQYLRMSHGERRLIERRGASAVTFKVLVRDPRSAPAATDEKPDEGVEP